jgi:hypothetical protein
VTQAKRAFSRRRPNSPSNLGSNNVRLYPWKATPAWHSQKGILVYRVQQPNRFDHLNAKILRPTFFLDFQHENRAKGWPQGLRIQLTKLRQFCDGGL